jgi:hypothetical protein
MMVSNSTKARVEGRAGASGSARRSAGQERAVKLAVTRREAFMQYKLHLSRMFELRRVSKTGGKP